MKKILEYNRIQLCCTWINRMKSDLSLKEFIDICRKITDYAKNLDIINGEEEEEGTLL